MFSRPVLKFSKEIFLTAPPKICDALRNLVPFVQFKKREKHPWRSVTFSVTFIFSHSSMGVFHVF